MRRKLRALPLLVLLTIGAYGCGPGRAPVGQPPVVTLTPEALQSLRQQFNDGQDAPRVIVLLSPT